MNRLTTDGFRDLLESLVKPEDSKLVVGVGRMVDMTDRFALVADSGVGIDLMNGLFERKNYRVTSRGRPESLQDSEKLANLIYEKLDGLENYDHGDIRILGIRIIAKPRQMYFVDDQNRYYFVAEYEVRSSQD